MHTGSRHMALMLVGTALVFLSTTGLRPVGSRRLPSAPNALNDSSDVAAAVVKFSASLAAGDSTAALALLTDDVVILESGGVETRAQYRSGHLSADIAFAQAVPSRRSPVAVRVRGDAAWTTSTSTTEGVYRGRPINSTGVELMVLTREPGGWKIRAVHWSSHARRSPS